MGEAVKNREKKKKGELKILRRIYGNMKGTTLGMSNPAANGEHSGFSKNMDFREKWMNSHEKRTLDALWPHPAWIRAWLSQWIIMSHLLIDAG